MKFELTKEATRLNAEAWEAIRKEQQSIKPRVYTATCEKCGGIITSDRPLRWNPHARGRYCVPCAFAYS